MLEKSLVSYPGRFKVIRGPEGTYSSKLVSLQNFEAGTVLALLGPECQYTNRKAYTTVQISEQTTCFSCSHLELCSDLVYINHSCDPNVIFDVSADDGLDKSLWKVQAIKDIKKDEALTFAYFSTEWDMAQPFDCRCGSDICLGSIRGAKYIPTNILSQYFINAHITRLKALQESNPSSGDPSN